MDLPQNTATIDIGTAIAQFREDPDWLKHVGIHGALSMVPLAGILIMYGWSRRIFGRLQQGDTSMPELELAEELSEGIAPLVALLNVMLVTIPVGLLIAIPAVVMSIFASDMGGMASMVMLVISLLSALLAIAVSMLLMFIQPELLRRGYNGEMTPMLSPGASIAAIKAHPKDYIMVVLGLILGRAISGMGVMLCGIGVIVTMPIGVLISTNVLAQWNRMVEGS